MLRVGGEPVADFRAFGMAGLEFEDFQVMLAREAGLAELLGVEVCERQVGTGLRGAALEYLLQFFRGIQGMAGLFEREREVVARVDGLGLEGQGHFVGRKGLFPAARVVGGEAEIVVGVEVGGIGIDGLLIVAERLVQLERALRGDAAGEMALRIAPIANLWKLGRGVAIARIRGRGRLRRKGGDIGGRQWPHLGRGGVRGPGAATKWIEPREESAFVFATVIGVRRGRRRVGGRALGGRSGLTRGRNVLGWFYDEVIFELGDGDIGGTLGAIGRRRGPTRR